MAVTVGTNRFAFQDPQAFVADAVAAEEMGFDYIWMPDSQMGLKDVYVMLALAAERTRRVILGPYCTNPVTRHPSITASAISTLDVVSDGRAALGIGVGDSAVLRIGQKPATYRQLEESVLLIRQLLRGEAVSLGGADPIRLAGARPAPVWVVASGPLTLRAAGRSADGVVMRAGAEVGLIQAALQEVHRGRLEAGRSEDSLRLGLHFYVALTDDREAALGMARIFAAAAYELRPQMWAAAGIPWLGPPIEAVIQELGRDLFHARDMDRAARYLSFIEDSVAERFCIAGDAFYCRERIQGLLKAFPKIEHVVVHPARPSEEFRRTFAERVLPGLK